MGIQLVHFDDQKNSVTLALWHATESTQELIRLALMDATSKSVFEKIPLEKRRREWLLTRLILLFIQPEYELGTYSNGKPYLKSGGKISISHCDDLAGIVFSNADMGLDIQNPHPKLMLIRTKFCNEIELIRLEFEPEPLKYLAIVWATKEAVFKFFGENVHFASDIELEPFQIQDEFVIAVYKGIHGMKRFKLKIVCMYNFYIVFIVSVKELGATQSLIS